MRCLPEETIRDLLRDGNMLGEFTDYRGRKQGAPKVQMFEFKEDKLEFNDRCIFIRLIGSSSVAPNLIQNNQIVVGFVSKRNDDVFVSRHRADDLYQFFIDNFEKNNMHGIVPSTPGTPFILGSGRRVFEMTLDTLIGRMSA